MSSTLRLSRTDRHEARPSRLALGTAQFGRPYGIANRSGQVGRDEAVSILECARAANLGVLDTAIDYGDSELRLGEIGVGQWQVISKLPAMPVPCTDVEGWVNASVLGSLERLQIPRLHGLLVHHAQQLVGASGDAVYQALSGVRNQGLVARIGVSVYGPDELDALSPRHQFDLVQAPLNVIDRRLNTSGWLTRLKQAGTEVHVRSVFLQGLLLMNEIDRPPAFSRWGSLWRCWHRWLSEQDLTPVQACLAFALAHAEVDRVVVGIDSVAQLEDILASAHTPPVEPPVELISEDQNLIHPSRWAL